MRSITLGQHWPTFAQWHKRVTLFHEFKSELSPPGRRFMSKTLVGTHIFGIRSPLVVYNGPIVRVVQKKGKQQNLTKFGKLARTFFQGMETSKLDFTGVGACQMMHDFKYEHIWSTFRHVAATLKKGVKWPTLGQQKVSILTSSNPNEKFGTLTRLEIS